ncbi:hypothetical protein [Spongiactinospora sp. TRM90649]|uniref:hypothetical protein n=1 Tax=Spongiactinospora sp. TRM90649 TaxID=3031114 RepID=UPI0023F77BB0|nr:hypothetical protein [Spongiactinospora sp. TRM90649]MDF5758230.1 hypothetical protein [Spongiactinospora sp. TRM90649]
MNNDQLFQDRARVRDEDLAGRASAAGADALLTRIVALEHDPAPRRRAFSPRRVLIGMVSAAALATAIVVGPSLLRVSERVYAGQAVTIDRVGDEYAFYFTEGDPDPAELQRAFRKVGLDNLTVTLIPVSPRQPGAVFGFDKADPGDDSLATFVGGDCPTDVNGCVAAFRVTADIKTRAEVRLARPAKPGEKYGFPADAEWPGEALAGVRLQGRSVAEAVRVVRERGLAVAYGLDWPSHGAGGGEGYEFEENVPAARIDPTWKVAKGDTYNDGVIVLHVVPGPGASPPPGF